METSIINVPMVSLRNQGKALVSAHKSGADAPLPLPKPQTEPVDVQQQLNQANERRVAVIRQAAQYANLFVISDQRFTIYKDLSGQFVTRFTSLRDGKVTYIPEPDVLSWLHQSGEGGSALSLEV